MQKAQRKPRTRELLGDGEEHRPGVDSVRDSQCHSRSGARGVDGRDAAGDQPRDATSRETPSHLYYSRDPGLDLTPDLGTRLGGCKKIGSPIAPEGVVEAKQKTA